MKRPVKKYVCAATCRYVNTETKSTEKNKREYVR
jgi:hypothetical protein